MTNILVVVTAYCLCKQCCGPNVRGINASGHKPTAGISIAGPRKYPLGTKVIIAGHTYTLDDRLAKRFDNRFDIFMSSHKQAINFGIRTNKVTIYEKQTK